MTEYSRIDVFTRGERPNQSIAMKRKWEAKRAKVLTWLDENLPEMLVDGPIKWRDLFALVEETWHLDQHKERQILREWLRTHRQYEVVQEKTVGRGRGPNWVRRKES